jgi:hypothetical protein
MAESTETNYQNISRRYFLRLKVREGETFYWFILMVSVLFHEGRYIARSNEILGWKGVGNRQLCFFKA